ncbi:hypothetical protein [Buttiauxella sp. 3AFRM03]|uniref:hypothetical protein n=1 Tax=Buttiauxella sp. 3AFRM03 TaxID=2479367 RepID=UPI001EE3EDD2|nr:hypothetical protein [Buttiauxella sp. 3AFRM03]
MMYVIAGGGIMSAYYPPESELSRASSKSLKQPVSTWRCYVQHTNSNPPVRNTRNVDHAPGKPWRAAVNKNGKLHIHRPSEAKQVKDLLVEIVLDHRNQPEVMLWSQPIPMQIPEDEFLAAMKEMLVAKHRIRRRRKHERLSRL